MPHFRKGGSYSISGRCDWLQKQNNRNVKDADEGNMHIHARMGRKGGHNSGSASTNVPARLQPADVTAQANPCYTVNCAETGHNRHGANNVTTYLTRATSQGRQVG